MFLVDENAGRNSLTRRSFVQQFSEVAAGDKSVGDLMEGVHAVIYFPLDTASVILGSHGSQDDDEMYRNVHSVPFPPPRRACSCM